MIRLRVQGTKSWLDPRSQRALSANLAQRLVDRCRGRRGVFVTLTYRRDEYQGPQDLYRCTSEQQHVPLFLRKVSRFVGESLKGRWFCKAEFQQGGWVHWHIIILGLAKIPHAELTRMWGRGHVWINRLSPRRIRYVCKYVSKGGQPPAWLLTEPTRSVKIVRVSPGFWGDTEARPSAPKAERSEGRRYPFWKSIGQRIEEAERKLVAKDDDGRYARVEGDLGLVLMHLTTAGHVMVANQDGWLVIDAELADLERAAQRAADSEARHKAAQPRQRRAACLHLTKPPNPDAVAMPRWLRAVYVDLLDVQDVGRGVLHGMA